MQLGGMPYAISFVRKNPFVSPFVCSSSSFEDPLNESRGNWDAGSLHGIYGSIAKGRERRASDVDVMVIGEASFAETSDALARTQSAIGREVNPSVYPRAEFCAKLGAKHHFLRSVLKSEKIFLIGNQRELARLAKA